MKRLLLISLFLGGCTAQAQSSQPSPTSTTTPSPQVFSAPSGRATRFALRLTLTAPEDLKVKEGDIVVIDQILSDRTRERQRLEAQKKQLDIQIQRLKQPIPAPLPLRRIPDIVPLPIDAFDEEQAAIAQAKLHLEKIERDRDNQQRKIDALSTLPPNEVPVVVVAHEGEKLKQRDSDVQQAQSELRLVEAKLENAKRNYQYQSYEYSLELSKRDISIQQQELEHQRQQQEQQQRQRDRDFQIAQVTAQLQNIETQLAALSIVRSPYNGKIQRVKWLGQDNQNLAVELTLITGDLRNVPRTTATTRNEATRNENRIEASPTSQITDN
jgi:hypothetical protein